jgi:hypothetical protein
MADTIAVQRGTHYTHGMHVYPGETALGVWASIEAQNAGLVAGMWQSHLVCSSDLWTWEVSGGFNPVWLNQWRVTWPQLGSYSRLSFWANARSGFLGGRELKFCAWFYDAGYTAVFGNSGTAVVEWETDDTRRISLEWDMASATLAPHLGEAIFVELVAWRPYEVSPEPESWTVRMNEFLLITANLPL